MLQSGDLVQVIFHVPDKGSRSYQKNFTFNLVADKVQNTHFGQIVHNDLIGAEIASTHRTINRTRKGVEFRVMTPTIAEATLAFPRGSAIIYPKDAASIITYGDIFPGSRVLECGLGSGAFTCSLLRAVGDKGYVVSVEKREDFAKTATRNIENFFGQQPANWQLVMGDFADYIAWFGDKDILHADSADDTNHEQKETAQKFDRVVLDLLNPWDYLENLHPRITKGGVLTCYITTTTQMQSLSDRFASFKGLYDYIECFEIIRRPWHLDGLSTRPEHQGIMHSGFILTARSI